MPVNECRLASVAFKGARPFPLTISAPTRPKICPYDRCESGYSSGNGAQTHQFSVQAKDRQLATLQRAHKRVQAFFLPERSFQTALRQPLRQHERQ